MIVVNKIRKERIAAGRANLPTKEELEQVRWVRCCECGKHRALPKGVTLDEMLEMYGLQHVSGVVSSWIEESGGSVLENRRGDCACTGSARDPNAREPHEHRYDNICSLLGSTINKTQ